MLLLCVSAMQGQSTSQDFPTPVTSSEISGSIKARDIGDARLTSYFYQFDGSQGDLFINIVTRNFTGDIDLFTLDGLRPLTKVVVYAADLTESETGRVIYLRKPERMLLRVQGRTPGDDVATFRIKFAGSFVASTMQEPPAEPALPTVTAKNESGIRVNSVGTIVEIIPKATPTPVPVDIASARTDDERDPPPANIEKPAAETGVKVDESRSDSDAAGEDAPKKVEVVVSDNLPEKTTGAPPARLRGRGRTGRAAPAKPPAETATNEAASTGETRRGRTAAKPPPPAEPDPLEKVNLVILFKDGTRIERSMSEVLRFTVDKGVLTVIAKDGSIGRYSILDVAKVTIE